MQASLRSTLTPDDDETELVPHVKGVTEFEIFEEVLLLLSLLSIETLNSGANVSSSHRPALGLQDRGPVHSQLQGSFPRERVFANPCSQVSGGGRVYSYSLQPDNLATVDSDGKVGSLPSSSVKPLQVSVHKGPGKFTVTAGMSGSMHNNHTAQVLLLNPAELELPESLAEWITGAAIQVLLLSQL